MSVINESAFLHFLHRRSKYITRLLSTFWVYPSYLLSHEIAFELT